MPHQCVRCGAMYDDGSQAILQGCTCGSKLFFYINKRKMERMAQEREEVKIEPEERKQIEKDVYDIIGDSAGDLPIVLDLESVNVSGNGKYELDLVHLFDKKQPLVYRVEEGKYMIDLPNSFKKK